MPGSLSSGEGLKRLTAGRRAVWAALALLCVVVGVVGSLLGARAVARDDADRARGAFRANAGGVASALQLAIQRDGDLAVGASTFFAAHPLASAAEFERWSAWAIDGRHYPELDRLALVGLAPVPLPGLASGARTIGASALGARTVAGRATTPPPSLAARHARTVSLDGQPYFCLTIGQLGSGSDSGPARDCLLTPTLLLTRDSGQTRYRSAAIGGESALIFDTPVYRGNALPVSTVGRRAAFVGWLREVLLPQRMLQQALRGYPHEALRVRYRTASASLLFTAGAPAAAAAQSVAVNLHGGWTARILGEPVQDGVLEDGSSLALLMVGCLASVLVGALILLLGGARQAPPSPAAQPSPDGAGPEQSLYDPLTGLPNHALSLDRAECMLARVGRQSGMLTGALIIDVDWFKDINDKLGREAGDQLLRVVAERLQSVVRADDTVGRLGEDKFVALVESQARGVKLESLAGRMIEALHEPVELEGFGPSFHMTASIGVAFGRYSRAEDLLGDTQVALDAAKAAGKDRFTLFNANLRSVIEDRGVLDSELNAALQDEQFFLLYQPIYDLSSRKVVGLEALIRWMHPTRGVVPAEDFVSAAEETALIVPIGRWALEEACARTAAWNAGGHRIGVAVKVSPSQMSRDGFASDVRRALQQSGIDPSALTLEIGEAAVIGDIDAAAARLSEIKQLGVRVAIEDFGNGYAYRSDLQRLPLSFLKVDRSSVAASDDEDYRSWLLEAIVLFARDLSLSVIVTQVQSVEQLAGLKRIGCTMIEGPLVGDPVPLDMVEAALEVELPVVEESFAAASASSVPLIAVGGQPVPVGVPVTVTDGERLPASELPDPSSATRSDAGLPSSGAAPAPVSDQLVSDQPVAGPPAAEAPGSAVTQQPPIDPPPSTPAAPPPPASGQGVSTDPTVIVNRPPFRPNDR